MSLIFTKREVTGRKRGGKIEKKAFLKFKSPVIFGINMECEIFGINFLHQLRFTIN